MSLSLIIHRMGVNRIVTLGFRVCLSRVEEIAMFIIKVISQWVFRIELVIIYSSRSIRLVRIRIINRLVIMVMFNNRDNNNHLSHSKCNHLLNRKINLTHYNYRYKLYLKTNNKYPNNIYKLITSKTIIHNKQTFNIPHNNQYRLIIFRTSTNNNKQIFNSPQKITPFFNIKSLNNHLFNQQIIYS